MDFDATAVCCGCVYPLLCALKHCGPTVPVAAKVWAAQSCCLQPSSSLANTIYIIIQINNSQASIYRELYGSVQGIDGVCIGRIKCPPACVQLIPTADSLQAALWIF